MKVEQYNRLGRLLHMWYTPSELAKEIKLDVNQIYDSYIPAGLPHRRDDAGHIWIDGTKFREWARESFTHKEKKLKPGQAYCLKCRKPVEVVDAYIRSMANNPYAEFLTGKCAECGATVNRAGSRKAKPVNGQISASLEGQDNSSCDRT